MTSSSSSWNFFAGRGAGKRSRPDPGSSSSGFASGGSTQGMGSGSALPPPPQQSRSYASAAGSSAKRSGPSPPAFPRPQLRRGTPVLKADQYESMERPAPATAAPNLLYVDMRSSTLSPEDILHSVFQALGSLIIGFQLFAAQKTLGLVFGSASAAQAQVNQLIGDTGLSMYARPQHQVHLLKLTLQGVPFWAGSALVDACTAAFREWGELVFLAPMVTADGLLSDQWHATLRVASNTAPPLPLSSRSLT